MSTARSERFIFNSKLREEKDYWLNRLATKGDTCTLRPDFERTLNPLGVKDTLPLTIPDEISQKLIEFSDNSPQLLYATLLAALKICLRKYTGSNSIVIGSPSLRITKDATSRTNVLAIIEQVEGHQSFQTMLACLRNTLDDAYAKQSYPFERLINDLGFERNAPGFPLFDIALAFENIHDEMPNLETDVNIVLKQQGNRIDGGVKYQPELFRPETIEQFTSHFINVLHSAVRAPLTPIRDLKLLTDEERHQLIVEWNQSDVPYPKDRCIPQVIEEHALRTPAAVALVHGEREMTYREFDQRTNQLARHLQSLGVGLESRVAVCTGRSLEMIVSIVATMKAGAVYVPLDPDYPEQRLSYLLNDSRAQVILTVSHLLDVLPQSGAFKVCLDTELEKIGDYSPLALPDVADSDNAAYMIYTSGSTGQPKGVLIPHRGLMNVAQGLGRALHISASSHVLQFSSFGFDASVEEIFTTLFAGATLHLGPAGTTQLAGDITKVLRDCAITVVTLPPALLAVTQVELLPALETILSAGEACPVEVVERWGRSRRFVNGYGPTENSVCASHLECDGVYVKSVPIGRPMQNVQLYILDRDMEPVPIGVPGELYIGGDSLARGYFSRPDLTAEKFVPNPFSSHEGGRLYRSGDLTCWLPAGVIDFLGRIDRQVKVRGFRIELGEVEAALKRMPDVREAVAGLARDGVTLVAYVVTSGIVSAEQLRTSLQAELPPFMVPGQVVLVERLPVTSHGKVDEAALRALAERMEPGGPAEEGGAPLGETERLVAEIWGSMLGIDGLGRQANFFDIGGHSLLATQVMSRIRSAFGLEVPIETLFDYATVADFAGQLETIRQTNEHSQGPVNLMYPREEGVL